jgi:hypothetical protein
VDQPQLRYIDCPATEASVMVAASPQALWALVTDIQLPARFSSEFRGAQWLDGATGPALGARFRGRNYHPSIGEWETTSTICEYQLERRFGWSVGSLEQPSARWRFILESQAGQTRLTQWMQMGPARSGINLAIDAMPEKESRILRRRLAEHQANMQATIDGIKAIAESSPQGPLN